MGRVPYVRPTAHHPTSLYLFRFTSPARACSMAAAARRPPIFSVDGGVTSGRLWPEFDPSDFLNSGLQGLADPFNEFYGDGTIQASPRSIKNKLDALGFHTTRPAVIETVDPQLVEVAASFILIHQQRSGPSLKFTARISWRVSLAAGHRSA